MSFLEPIRGVMKSVAHAARGIRLALSSQRNFRLHSIIAGAVVVAGIVVRFGRVEWILLIVTIGFVMTAELLNTALEYLLNLLEAHYHPVARTVKDVAAAAVLLASAATLMLLMEERPLAGPPQAAGASEMAE